MNCFTLTKLLKEMNKNICFAILILFVIIFNGNGQVLKHPGLINSSAELDFIRTKILAGEQPWKKAYDALILNAPLTYNPKFYANLSASANQQDSMTVSCSTAYAYAFLWYVNRNQRYADKAISILNGWSIFRTHPNALYLSWAVPHLMNAAEIMQYTPGSGWKQADIDIFTQTVRNYMLPINKKSFNTANILMTSIESHMSMAIYLDDKTEFNLALTRWRKYVPTVIYLTTDGTAKVTICEDGRTVNTWTSWSNNGPYANGLICETCRDLNHTKMSMNAMASCGEMAWKQGIDLFSEELIRYSTTFEVHAGWMDGTTPIPADVCPLNSNGGIICDGTSSSGQAPCNIGVFEIMVNHLCNRLGQNLPNLKKMTYDHRGGASTTTRGNKNETLTNADIPYGMSILQDKIIINEDTGIYSFDNTNIGNITPVTFTIKNNGIEVLSSNALTITGTNADQFSVSNISMNSIPGLSSSATFTITFVPTSVGNKVASITVNTPLNKPYTFQITGNSTPKPTVVETNLRIVPFITISSNPSNDIVKIAIAGFESPKIQLIDIYGNVVFQSLILKSDQLSLNISTIGCRGIYFVVVTGSNTSKTEKMIIK